MKVKTKLITMRLSEDEHRLFTERGKQYGGMSKFMCAAAIQAAGVPRGKTFVFDIQSPTGADGFSELITVTINSGDHGGELTGEDSFQEKLLVFLKEWFAGSKVSLKNKETKG